MDFLRRKLARLEIPAINNVAILNVFYPECVSDARYDGSLTFHTFPKDADLQKQWVVAIRRDEGLFFKITQKTYVCSYHFKPDDYKYAPVRKTLKPGSVPSIFKWSTDRSSRKDPTLRQPLEPIRKSKQLRLENMPPPEQEGITDAVTQTDLSLPDIRQLLSKIQQLEKDKSDLQQQLSIERFGVQRFSTDDAMMSYYTSFRDYHSFKIFFDFVKPSACNMCSKYYVCSDNITLAGRPRNMLLIDELFIYLCCEMKCYAWII